MTYIKAFLYRELCELKSEKKKILALLIVTLLPLITLFNDPLAFIDPAIAVKYLIYLIPFAVSGQLAVNLIINEKESGTLNIILNNSIPKYSIFIGKAFPSVIIGFIYFLITIGVYQIASLIFDRLVYLNIDLFFIATGFFISYISVSVSFLSNIITTDVRFIPIIGAVLIGGILGSLYLLNKFFMISTPINIIILILISLSLNFVAILSLNKTKRLLL